MGSGPHPLYLNGEVYLTTSYKSAPFGLTIVVPAIAGPFNLGTVVVRATINVDPNTSALTITSDPLPQIIAGVSTQVQSVSVNVDRAGFMFNPTNCSEQWIDATVLRPRRRCGGLYAVCRDRLPWPGLYFEVHRELLGENVESQRCEPGRKDRLHQRTGNIKTVKVLLPKQLPSRLTTIQKACPDSVFNANPAASTSGLS